MITGTGAPRKTGRTWRLALVLSVLVHVLAAFLVVGTYERFDKLFPARALRRVPDEVAVSTVVHLEKRSKPVPSRPARSARVAVRSRPVSRPHPATRAALAVAAAEPRTVGKPTPAPAPRARHELAKRRPHATPVPLATGPPQTEPPRAVLRRASAAARAAGQRRSAPARVALAPQHPPAETDAVPRTATRYSRAQLAAIQNDLARSIAVDRSSDSPLSNVNRAVHPATTQRRRAIDFSGIEGRLHGFEGLCEPIKTWPSGSFIYFYLTCRVTHDDGLVREEALPWPVRYPARRLSYDQDGPLLPSGGPVAPPLPGWHPDPSQKLDPDVILYLRKNGYPI